MLLDELRIAYRGWDTVAIQLEVEARRHKPTIASSVTDEFRAVMEQMKQQQASRSSSGSETSRSSSGSEASRSSSGSEASRSSTNHVTSGHSDAVSSSEHLITTSNHSRVVDTISGTLTTVTLTSAHQASSSLSSASSSSASSSAAAGRGFLSMVDEIEDEINSEYGYTGGSGGSRMDASKLTKRMDPLSRNSNNNNNNNKRHANSSTGSSSKASPKPNNNDASPTMGKGGGGVGGGAFKPTVGLGASVELRRAYELLMKQQQMKDGC